MVAFAAIQGHGSIQWLPKAKCHILSIPSVRNNRAQTMRSTWQGEFLRTRTVNLLTWILVHFYVTHRHEKLSQQWWPWRMKGYCCFHGSFHHNPRKWFDWLLREGKMSYIINTVCEERAQASQERTAIVNFLVFVVQFGCVPWYWKDWKKGIAVPMVRLVGRGNPN
jgi:hypothetical protein